MAKVIAPCLSLEARNQLGQGIIFNTRKGQSIVKMFNKPSKAKTQGQILQRLRYKNYREQWRYMTTQRKAVFNQRAKEQNRVSGYHQFLHENLDLNRKGQLYQNIDTIGLWHLNEESGNTAYDATRLHNDGTIYAAERVAGKFNGALDFPTTNDYVGPVLLGELGAPFTIETWTYFGYIDQPLNNSDYTLVIGLSPNAVSISRRKAGVDVNRFYTLSENKVVYGPVLQGRQWLYIATVYNQTPPYLELYINGEPQAVEQPTHAVVTNGDLTLAKYVEDDAHHLLGMIDEVAVHRKSFTPEEIKASFNLSL